MQTKLQYCVLLAWRTCSWRTCRFETLSKVCIYRQIHWNKQFYHQEGYNAQLEDLKTCDNKTADVERETTKNDENKLLFQKRLGEICYELKQRDELKKAALEFGIEGDTYQTVMSSFCSLLRKPKHIKLNNALYEVLIRVHDRQSHVDDLFPFLIEHVRQKYPLVFTLPKLKSICDLSDPTNWYPSTLSMQRKFVLHLGPTNSGKTHNAHQHFMSGDKGIYCAPLRMLAVEVFQKTNDNGVPCDLVTGEERIYASGSEDSPAYHVACTIEMANVYAMRAYDVAVIDEVQMIKDKDRGGAWTRAILGLPANVIHICGEPTTLPILQKLIDVTGSDIQVKSYNRLTSLVPLKYSLHGDYSNVRPGDCIVTFSRNKIFQIRKQIEQTTRQPCALVYGGLPAATRNYQAELFNSSKVEVLVASDAIGMGINLNIKRIIFHTLSKYDGGSIRPLSTSQTKQIAGRAGRFGKQNCEGEVTTFYDKDLQMMHKLLLAPVDDIKQAGLSPTLDQIERFSYHLPDLELHEILDMFMRTAEVNENYFLCQVALEKQIAVSRDISKYGLPLKDAYNFSLSPVEIRKSFTISILHHFAKSFAQDKPVTTAHLCHHLYWPLPRPYTPDQMAKLEEAHEVLDLYLWFSMRYPEHFPEPEGAKKLQEELEKVIGHSLAIRVRRNYSNKTIPNFERQIQINRKKFDSIKRGGNEQITPTGRIRDN